MNVRSEDAAVAFEPLRPKLLRVAYRMLGSVHDAEDIVQEAFIRWWNVDRSDVREPEAFLRRTVTRFANDFIGARLCFLEVLFALVRGSQVPGPGSLQ